MSGSSRQHDSSMKGVPTSPSKLSNTHQPQATTTGKRKAPDTSSSSSSSSTSSAAAPPPPPVQPLPGLHLHTLPDLAHDTIASYLSHEDFLRIMEGGTWLLTNYGSKVKEIGLRHMTSLHFATAPGITSVIHRRPSLVRIKVAGAFTANIMLGVAEAIRLGYCDSLTALRLGSYDESGPQAGFPTVFHVLRNGHLCPRLQGLHLSVAADGDVVVAMLGDALRSRMANGGCCGLTSFGLERRLSNDEPCPLTNLSPLLQSGACEALEEVVLGDKLLNPQGLQTVADWLLSGKALELRLFIIATGPTSSPEIAALCSPGVAPHLQSLDISNANEEQALVCLTQALQARVWPHLRELRLEPSFDAYGFIPALMEAIRVGVPELRVFKLNGNLYEGGGQALALALQGGSCGVLEELDLMDTRVRDEELAALMEALASGAPCSTTLRRLNLRCCDIQASGMKDLARALTRGACPNLESLDLSRQYLLDEGVGHLARAMEEGTLKKLRHLLLDKVRLTDAGASVLLQALGHDACPQLQSLDLSNNVDLREDVVTPMVEAMRVARSSHVSRVDLVGLPVKSEGWSYRDDD